MPNETDHWPRIAKLADLGLSFFAEDSQYGKKSLGREHFGTKDYGELQIGVSHALPILFNTQQAHPNATALRTMTSNKVPGAMCQTPSTCSHWVASSSRLPSGSLKVQMALGDFETIVDPRRVVQRWKREYAAFMTALNYWTVCVTNWEPFDGTRAGKTS